MGAPVELSTQNLLLPIPCPAETDLTARALGSSQACELQAVKSSGAWGMLPVSPVTLHISAQYPHAELCKSAHQIP